MNDDAKRQPPPRPAQRTPGPRIERGQQVQIPRCRQCGLPAGPIGSPGTCSCPGMDMRK